MTRDEILKRIYELEKEIAQMTQWGAAVSVRYEELEHLKYNLRHKLYEEQP